MHASPRILLVGGASDTLRQARKLASTYPRSRVTLLAEQVEPPLKASLLESGVEVIEAPLEDEWLGARSGHYSHVVASPKRLETLRATQFNAVTLSSLSELEAMLAR